MNVKKEGKRERERKKRKSQNGLHMLYITITTFSYTSEITGKAQIQKKDTEFLIKIYTIVKTRSYLTFSSLYLILTSGFGEFIFFLAFRR